MIFINKHRKAIFYILVGLIFVSILAYNVFTPFLSDDLTFTYDVRKATGIWDLFVQQWGDYNGHNGRFVGQLCIRFSLYFGMGFYNVMNSIMFTALVLIIYGHITKKRSYSISTLLLSLTFLWVFSVNFGQTMLWTAGSCNYLWGSVFIFGFLLLFRKLLKNYDTNLKGKNIAIAMGMLFFAVIAGWCSENTSGGALLMVLILLVNCVTDARRMGNVSEDNTISKDKIRIPLFGIASIIGLSFGLIMMILSPGNAQRSELSAGLENHEGIMKYFSHIYKVTVTVKNLFLPLFIIITITIVILMTEKYWKEWKNVRNSTFWQFILVGMATSYALVLVTLPPDRAFFGAGVLFIMASIEGISLIQENDRVNKLLKYSLISVLCLIMFFDYFENLVNLARIKREENSRISMIEEAINRGDNEAVIPNYHPEFNNRFTTAYDAETTDDPEFWINRYYEEYTGIEKVIALPYEEWEEIYGKWE